MDNNARLRAESTIKCLRRNAMNAVYVETREEALKEVESLIEEGASTSSGGSMSLRDCGIIPFLKEHTHYIDRNDPMITKEEKIKREREAFFCDYYLLSANAITEHGELYEVDGNGNRVAALLYGPKKVIVVAGINKLVPSLRAAAERVKHIACPANCLRLGLRTYCASKGTCVDNNYNEDNLMFNGSCGGSTICSDVVIVGRQSINPGRITVIIVGENIGY